MKVLVTRRMSKIVPQFPIYELGKDGPINYTYTRRIYEQTTIEEHEYPYTLFLTDKTIISVQEVKKLRPLM